MTLADITTDTDFSDMNPDGVHNLFANMVMQSVEFVRHCIKEGYVRGDKIVSDIHPKQTICGEKGVDPVRENLAFLYDGGIEQIIEFGALSLNADDIRTRLEKDCERIEQGMTLIGVG